MSEENLSKVPDEEIWRLRDEASYGEDVISVPANTLFEMCVEIELRRHDTLSLTSANLAALTSAFPKEH